MARKILLADDSVTAQNMGRKILADAGYEVITVNNGSAALKKIAELKPDVIVLDVYMPGYSGLEVCQRLKEVSETSRIPILLTVGKLEPFKPEEVKRVRADGFIVKPFEASELLSALSKLEDRIVPRSEPSKPGRFARATASLEDGRYDKTVAIEEDSGWKNRISFPSKKKEKEKEQEEKGTPQREADDPAIYNPVNKDLRTVVEPKAEDARLHPKGEDERVDLGALAPAGLPKDVTPEEIAALAAAAAQVQGTIEESRIAQPTTEPTVPAPVGAQKTESNEEISAPEAKLEAAAATFAEQKAQESVDAKETVAAPAASSSDIPVAAALLESRTEIDQPTSSADESSHAVETADEPVTMAQSGVARPSAASSRWTAVAVTLAPEDAGISLEQEMQKAYAAFAAAEAGHVQSATREAKADIAVEGAPAIDHELPEPVVSVPATVAPAVAENLNEVASAATEAISAVAAELEAVAASFLAPRETAAIEPLPASSEPTTGLVSESVVTAEPGPAAADSPVDVVYAEALEAKPEISQTFEETSQTAKQDAPSEESKLSLATIDDNVRVAGTDEVPAQESAATIPTEATATASEPTAEVAEGTLIEEPPAAKEKEPDLAATTAAAWASWHRVRESGPPDVAAKAVAAGAEDSPNDVAGEPGSDPGIASIVDSVLADLRPKIVEEISRKLGKKK